MRGATRGREGVAWEGRLGSSAAALKVGRAFGCDVRSLRPVGIHEHEEGLHLLLELAELGTLQLEEATTADDDEVVVAPADEAEGEEEDESHDEAEQPRLQAAYKDGHRG